jgi:hypothetical protein
MKHLIVGPDMDTNKLIIASQRQKGITKFRSLILRPLKSSRRMLSGISLGGIIRVCPCGGHAWYDSNVGPVRKPIQ